MYDISFLCPNHALIIGIPNEFEVFFLRQIIGYGEVDLEPVCSPTGTKRFANMGVAEFVGGCLLEGRPREVWWGVDFKPDPLVAGCAGFNDLAVVMSVAGRWQMKLNVLK